MGVLAILKIIAMALYPIVEFFLGKTSQGSVLGVILNLIATVLNYFGASSLKKKGE